METQAGSARLVLVAALVAALGLLWFVWQSPASEEPALDDLALDDGPGPSGDDQALLRAESGTDRLPRGDLGAEDLEARGPLPSSVQVATAGDWQRAMSKGSPDLGPFWDAWFDRGDEAEEEPTPPPQGVGDGHHVPAPRPPVHEEPPPLLPAPEPDGDGVLRVLAAALEGRVPLRFESAAALTTFRRRRCRARVPQLPGADALVDLCAEEFRFRAVVLDGALYFRPGSPATEVKEDRR